MGHMILKLIGLIIASLGVIMVVDAQLAHRVFVYATTTVILIRSN